MPVGIGAGGMVGFALEVTPSTYVAPTKFVPVMSESLKWTQDTTWRRPIRQIAGVVGAILGRGHVEGDIQMEAFEDIVPYFLDVARTTVVKTGAGPNFIYTATPNANAVPAKTMSVTVVRNGIVFGYVGCIVSSFTLTTDNDALMFNCSMLGTNETTQSLPTPTWPTTVPFGHGQYSIQIPTATQVFDCDGFEFTVDDNGEEQYRLKSIPGTQFASFGERSVTLTSERDFFDRTEYDAFKALTAQTVTIVATKSATNLIQIDVPVAIKDTYEVGLSGQGDIIRAATAWQGVTDGTGKDYQITCKSQEVFTP